MLLDECLPQHLARSLHGHTVRTVSDMGWNGLQNGDLLQRAEREFDVFLTVDRNLSFQQDVNRYAIAVLVLVAKTNQLRDLEPLASQVLEVCSYLLPGQVAKVP